MGGEDQITVVPHLDPAPVQADPKPFLGYSDNTNLLCWLWTHGIPAFRGGSTQVHLGAGPDVDPVHAASLRAALLTGERLEITDPGISEDFGPDWLDPAALTEYGDRDPTEPWTWAGPAKIVTGRTWGGCTEVLQWILTAREFGWILRSLGERGVLRAVDAVVVARPPAAEYGKPRPHPRARAAHRYAQREMAIETVQRYNPDAVIVVGVPFGHTRPQWILPFGGFVTVDGAEQRLWADYR